MIFHYTPTSCSLASNIALEEAGVAYEASLVKLWKPEDVAAYKGDDPGRTVPALRVGDTLITENTAILQYVARLRPEARLLPDDALALAVCQSRIGWFASSVHIACRQVRAPFRFTPDETAQARLKESGLPVYRRNLDRLDALYSAGPWMLGDQFTVADCYALVFYDWGVQDGFDMAALPAFTAFKDRMLARPAVLRALERHRSVLLAGVPTTQI